MMSELPFQAYASGPGKTEMQAGPAVRFLGDNDPEVLLDRPMTLQLGGAETDPPRVHVNRDPYSGISEASLSAAPLGGSGVTIRTVGNASVSQTSTCMWPHSRLRLREGKKKLETKSEKYAIWVEVKVQTSENDRLYFHVFGRQRKHEEHSHWRLGFDGVRFVRATATGEGAPLFNTNTTVATLEAGSVVPLEIEIPADDEVFTLVFSRSRECGVDTGGGCTLVIELSEIRLPQASGDITAHAAASAPSDTSPMQEEKAIVLASLSEEREAELTKKWKEMQDSAPQKTRGKPPRPEKIEVLKQHAAKRKAWEKNLNASEVQFVKALDKEAKQKK
jgi:hypothetical protein